MSSTSISTERLRFLIEDKKLQEKRYKVCNTEDISGPGGGIYIRAHTPLTEKHLEWLENRNPSPDNSTFVDVDFIPEDEVPSRDAAEEPEAFGITVVAPADQKVRWERAHKASKNVVEDARKVAKTAQQVFRSVKSWNFSPGTLAGEETQASIREFQRSFKSFHGAVKHAIDEYLGGNTLVMDLILKHRLDMDTVRHGLNVAAFATEMAALLASKDKGRVAYLGHYFEGMSNEDLLCQLGEPVELAARLSSKEIRNRKRYLFKGELVEIFLGGFMHDCGLWTDNLILQEGHEAKGARLIAATKELQEHAPVLLKIVLFHSDIMRLASRYGVAEISVDAEHPEHGLFRREFYQNLKDARAASRLHQGVEAEVLEKADLRKIMPVALAEYYVSQTQDVYAKPHWKVVHDLVQYIGRTLYRNYMVVLCNSRLEVVAPKGAYLELEGNISVIVQDKKDERKPQRVDVGGFGAVSIHHGGDKNSPHLITLFYRGPDGGREQAEYIPPYDSSLWERTAGPQYRMYVPAGRYKNSLSLKVTGFMSKEVYVKVLGEYEREFKRRNQPG